MPTTTNTITVDAASTVLVGDQYDETAELSLGELADRIRTDIRDVQRDEMIPAEAALAVTADESGPQNLIRITVSGLHRVNDDGTADPFIGKPTRKAFRTAFGLASNYNRFESHPYRLRFLVVLEAITDDGTVYGVGVGAFGRWEM